MRPPLHYYLFSFAFKEGFSSTTMGWPSKNVTQDRIKEAKIASGASYDAVPLAVSYLGYMSPDKVQGGDA